MLMSARNLDAPLSAIRSFGLDKITHCIGLCIFIALSPGCGGGGGGGGMKTVSVTVPNEVGNTQAVATAAITAAGLTVGTTTQATSASVSTGSVISENPAAGSSVAPGTAVNLTISSGLPPVMETTLYSFGGSATDGYAPSNGLGLVQGPDGNFYGTTTSGGYGADTFGGVGAFYKITPEGVETVLYAFGTGAQLNDAIRPLGGLTLANGDFYGVGRLGGVDTCGAFFKVTTSGVETVLYSFVAIATDGCTPWGAPTQGTDGNFYGTTVDGGIHSGGIVYRITPPSGGSPAVETVLYSFGASSTDGMNPTFGVIQATDGNFYGTTACGGGNGGAAGCAGVAPGTGDGTVFKMTAAGVVTILHSFGGSSADGATPNNLIQGTDGDFYGTTVKGGTSNGGTFYKITPAGVETVLYSFCGSVTDGCSPQSGVIQGADGNFYGTTSMGGGASNGGTVYMVTPAGVETVLYSFGASNSVNGSAPFAGLTQGMDGTLYGTTSGGGAFTNNTSGVVVYGGTFFKVTP